MDALGRPLAGAISPSAPAHPRRSRRPPACGRYSAPPPTSASKLAAYPGDDAPNRLDGQAPNLPGRGPPNRSGLFTPPPLSVHPDAPLLPPSRPSPSRPAPSRPSHSRPPPSRPLRLAPPTASAHSLTPHPPPAVLHLDRARRPAPAPSRPSATVTAFHPGSSARIVFLTKTKSSLSDFGTSG